MPFEHYLEPYRNGNGQTKLEENKFEAQPEMNPNDLQPDVLDVESNRELECMQSYIGKEFHPHHVSLLQFRDISYGWH